jgi:hypothetical protein
MVTERALTILRIRRSTKDTFLPGLTRLSGTSSKFNDQVDSPCISPFARQVRFGDAVRPEEVAMTHAFRRFRGFTP